jgi:hypothetical protein
LDAALPGLVSREPRIVPSWDHRSPFALGEGYHAVWILLDFGSESQIRSAVRRQSKPSAAQNSQRLDFGKLSASPVNAI